MTATAFEYYAREANVQQKEMYRCSKEMLRSVFGEDCARHLLTSALKHDTLKGYTTVASKKEHTAPAPEPKRKDPGPDQNKIIKNFHRTY